MGCAASKLENEDTVRRCKDRRRLMKEAVYARHHLAAAHSDYCRSLRLTGSALSTFASGEPLSVSDNTPAVFLNPKTTTPTPITSTFHHPPQPPPSSHSSLHPPPPPPFNPSPSPTIHSSKLPHILSSSSINSTTTPTPHHHQQQQPPQRRRKQPPPKLPHILSDSSPSSTPRSQASNNFASNFFPTAHSTYSSTPSQTSSVWNWENFYPPPPPPPGSDTFDREHEELETASQFSFISRNSENTFSRQHQQQQQHQHQPQQPQSHQQQQQQQQRYPTAGNDVDGFESERSEYDYFNEKLAMVQKNKSHHHQHQNQNQHHLEDYTETEREEVECSEWGDHYSTTTSSDEDDEEEDEEGAEGDVESRSEIGGTRSNFGSSRMAAAVKVAKSEDLASSSTGEGLMEMKMIVRHRDLKEIVDAIKENFDKAAVAGDQVSEMLEISKAQLDRSFRQLKLRKTVYHSSSLLSSLSSTWTSKPPLAVKYRLDAGSLDEPGGLKSLCSTLERLLAWEKKLYEEVKTRESVKIEHEKKLSALQSQEYKGEDEAKIFKTKSAINRLQSLIVVTSQAVSTTSY